MNVKEVCNCLLCFNCRKVLIDANNKILPLHTKRK